MVATAAANEAANLDGDRAVTIVCARAQRGSPLPAEPRRRVIARITHVAHLTAVIARRA